MSTNFFGVYYVIRSFIPLMEKQGYGRIVNLSSEYGMMSEMAQRGAGAYKLSKLALNGLTRLVAAEIQGDIKINAVCPGWVRTDMAGKAAPRSPKQAAESILWLATIGPEGPQDESIGNHHPLRFALMLAIFSALGLFTVDMYLSSLPQIGDFFGTSTSTVQAH
jgi:NAD(P)-dependent dehydrogenase (short-subunit alcohol dehydrogenase family)